MLRATYREIKEHASDAGQSVSQFALERLETAYKKTINQVREPSANLPADQQLLLFPGAAPLGKHGTFSPNHWESIHRWYPYIEGFSSTFVRSLIAKWGVGATSIYDPFAGTGTTMTVAAQLGLAGYYSEINPFMRLVIEGKTNILREVAPRQDELRRYLSDIVAHAIAHPLPVEAARLQFQSAFSDRPYYSEDRLTQILAIRQAIALARPLTPAFKHIALLALGSIGVHCSEMKRAADLRYRTPKEVLPPGFDCIRHFDQKVQQILDDIDPALSELTPVTCLADDVLKFPSSHLSIDLIVTSPPYLNGTNYFRNTKIELWLTGQISSEKDLGAFTRGAVTAGINNVSDNGREVRRFDFVEHVAEQLDEVAYDRRIPELVRRYCSDAETWLRNCLTILTPGGRAVVDIGDSRFAGVHVPTDKFLERIAEHVGFKVAEVESVRARVSKDGSPLTQVLLILEKPSSARAHGTAAASDRVAEVGSLAKDFERDLPHQRDPYAARNWGHSLHSLCSYQGKLKPAVAHFLVSRFTRPGDTVLDPMSGAGTIPLEAYLLGRKALANDIQELAYILSFAKVRKPSRDLVIDELEALLGHVEENWRSQNDRKYAKFGFNGKIPEYFEPRTMKELLAARRYMQDRPVDSGERALVYAALLHVLHGNRPYALSRRSHPVTPLKPTGEFEYRDIRSRLTDKVVRALESHDERRVIAGSATFGSFEDLGYRGTVDAVITSPPFAASTRFYVSNWMRLWMSGWEPADFESKRDRFIEHRQKTSFEVYETFFRKCFQWLRPRGVVILHVGKTVKHDMAAELSILCAPHFDVAYSFDESVAGREKFGLKDQGATKAHQYLFLVKRPE
jgi:DNA modification methylase